jgi:hypothetical protein
MADPLLPPPLFVGYPEYMHVSIAANDQGATVALLFVVGLFFAALTNRRRKELEVDLHKTRAKGKDIEKKLEGF